AGCIEVDDRQPPGLPSPATGPALAPDPPHVIRTDPWLPAGTDRSVPRLHSRHFASRLATLSERVSSGPVGSDGRRPNARRGAGRRSTPPVHQGGGKHVEAGG